MQNCWEIFGSICLERKLDLGNFALAILGLFGLMSIFFAYRQMRLARRAYQTQSAIHLFQAFMSDREIRQFLYRLDYLSGARGWRFDPNSFPNSTEEMHLDHILYQLSFIGTLLDSSDLTLSDLSWIKPELGIVLNNPEVHNYLTWLKSPSQIPNHSGFVGAINLYAAFYGEDTIQFSDLKRYLDH